MDTRDLVVQLGVAGDVHDELEQFVRGDGKDYRALYKHFASKRALLEAVVETHVATMRDGRQWFAESLPEDRAAALQATADAVVAGIGRDRHAVRHMLRDLDDEPELRQRLWREVMANVYEPFSDWVVGAVREGRLQVADPKAFVHAWTRLALAALDPPRQA